MSRGVAVLLVAQFLTAFADKAPDSHMRRARAIRFADLIICNVNQQCRF